MNDLFWHNPLAEMYGPQFLILYATVAACVLLYSFRKVRWREPEANRAAYQPDGLDPYLLAYLRGRQAEVLRLAVLSLIQKGHLGVVTRTSKKGEYKDIVAMPTDPQPGSLTGVDQSVFDGLARSSGGFCSNASELEEAIDTHCRGYKALLEHEDLIPKPERYRAAWKAKLGGGVVLVGLAVYKLAAALLNGHTNVAILILLTVASLFTLWVGCNPPQQTARGKHYLNSLATELRKNSDLRALRAPLSEPAMLLLFAVLGVSVLQSTAYASVYDAFEAQRASQHASGGGCGGGGGGEGEGGGCGGGGCGGCGGCGG